ncbi:MAG: beta-lactamase family protein, partial [Hyphomonadaceae bacterium]|nr:beta-lactamase family protein [Hyphomonadaceae bacterium]
ENLQVWSADGPPGPVSRPPTMRELMSHTAGFAYGLSDITPPDAEYQALGVLAQPDLDTFIETVAGVPLLMEPGTNWYYSLSVDIQGAIIERVTGESFGAFLEDRIFDPLGMDDTGFFVPEAEYDRFGDVFITDSYTGNLEPFTEPWVTFREDSIAFESGGGGLVSTLDDYARFCQMLLDDGAFNDVQILKPESVALMTTNLLTEDQSIFSDGGQGDVPTGVGFGLNVGVITGPAATDRYGLGTHFWGGAAGTWYWVDPENDLFFIGMIQRFDAGGDQTIFREVSGELVHEALNDRH